MGIMGIVIPTNSIIRITMLGAMADMGMRGMRDMEGMGSNSHATGVIKGMLPMAILGMGRPMVMVAVKDVPEGISILISMEAIRPMGKFMAKRKTVAVAVVGQATVGNMVLLPTSRD